MDASTVIGNCDTLKTEKYRYMSELYECMQYAAWERSQMYLGSTQNMKDFYIVINDVQEANQTFVRGMYSNLCPASVRWFSFVAKLINRKKKISESLQRWMSEVTTIAYELLMSSNFTQQIVDGLTNLGGTGLINLYIEQDFEKTFKFLSIHASEYFVKMDAFGYSNGVYREYQLTAAQCISEFRKGKLPEEIIKAGTSEHEIDRQRKFTIIHAVESNPDIKYEENGMPLPGSKNKAFKSIYVCRETKSILKESGYDEMPYAFTAFIKDSKSAYGRGPTMMCLRSAKILNKVELTQMKGEEKMVDPPVILDMASYDATKGLNPQFYNKPGGVNLWDSQKQGNSPAYMNQNIDLNAAEKRKDRLINTINKAFFVDVFQMAHMLNENDKRERTAYEWNRLISEKNQMVIPITAGLLQEFFSILLKRVFWISYRSGKFPPAPPEIADMADFQVEFNSPLALAAQQTEMNQLFQAAELLVPWSQFQPTLIPDLIKFEDVGIKLFEKRGVNPDFYRTIGEIQKRQGDRAQAQAEQQEQAGLMELAKSQNLQQKPEEGSAIGALVSGGI